jgi:type VI secretion system secreted protein VgrG
MFGVLGASAVTNTGNTVIDGDLGVYPGTSITGFPPGLVNGTTYDGDAVAMQAQSDALAAYNFFAGLSSNGNLSGQNLGGLDLTPGVYTYNSSAQLTGTLEINWEGLSNQNVVFQIGSTLTTASASMVIGINAGQNDNIYWIVGSSATLGTTTAFQGTVIAVASDTLNTGATDECGRIIALNGAVTLDDNFIDNCAATTTTTTGTTTTGTTPEPSSIFLFGSGILSLAGFVRRRLF